MPKARTAADGRRSERALRLCAVAVGGALGTLARYAVSRALAVDGLGFPWPTFAVNVVGSFLLGLLITVLVERWPPTRFLRAFVAVGFCGGFTTFSTMVVEAAQRGQHGRAGLAAVYLAVSLIAGLLAAAAGIGAGTGPPPPPGREAIDPRSRRLRLACRGPRGGPPRPDDQAAADRPGTDGPGRDHRGIADRGRPRAPRCATGWTVVVQRRMGSDFPLGILVVNLSGSLVLGVLVGSATHHGLSPFWLTVAGTGLVGAYTTFSTFTFDVVSLAENGEWGASALNILFSLGGGLGAARLAWRSDH